MKTAPGQTRNTDTRQRLIEAAARVFGRSGLEGSTTREIAREAAVNEVTLFRHFHSKENLLAEVVRRTFDQDEDPTPTHPASSVPPPVPELRADLRRYAHRYAELLEPNLPLLRTFLGEIHRHREHEFCVLKGIFAPLKAELRSVIQAAKARNALRADLDPLIVADLFGSMIFVEVLRRPGPFAPEYPTERYYEAAVEIFARGIER